MASTATVTPPLVMAVWKAVPDASIPPVAVSAVVSDVTLHGRSCDGEADVVELDTGGGGNSLPDLDLLGRVIVGDGTGYSQDCGDLGGLLRPLACSEAPPAHVLDVGLRRISDQDFVARRGLEHCLVDELAGSRICPRPEDGQVKDVDGAVRPPPTGSATLYGADCGARQEEQQYTLLRPRRADDPRPWELRQAPETPALKPGRWPARVSGGCARFEPCMMGFASYTQPTGQSAAVDMAAASNRTWHSESSLVAVPVTEPCELRPWHWLSWSLLSSS
eukprot:scaffold96351_cov55-Phaeocystis_antarctica.AAC.4